MPVGSAVNSGKTVSRDNQHHDSARRSGRWPRIAIIGAGVSGICAAIRLGQAGIGNFVILEKADRIGGTWRENTYPGAACDVPAHLYSYSFAPKKNWSRKFAVQPEILTYLEQCVRDFAIEDRIQFGADVVAADYSDSKNAWRIRLADGETVEAHVLISACGQLHRPRIPAFRGQDTFSGPSFHSAEWRHDCDLTGLSVAIIGNAASAVQIAPAIAPTVGKLTIFQRSPNWIARRSDRPYSPLAKSLFSRVPMLRRLYRSYLYLQHEILFVAFRSASLANRALAAGLKFKMRRKITDPKMHDVLLPDYPPGSKRILRAPDYLRLMSHDKVVLVTDEIARIEPEGVVTGTGQLHAADAIVYATGFSVSDFLAPMQIKGRGGISLNDAWSCGAEAHLGMTMPGFPNFFMLYGPNTSLGHNSVIFMVECQTAYVVQMLQHMQSVGATVVELSAGAFGRFKRLLAAGIEKTVWAGDCHSYYKTESGRLVAIWPFSTVRYWLATRTPRYSDYIFENNASGSGEQSQTNVETVDGLSPTAGKAI